MEEGGSGFSSSFEGDSVRPGSDKTVGRDMPKEFEMPMDNNEPADFLTNEMTNENLLENEYTIRLEDANKTMVKSIGEKASNLSELKKAGVPVPSGFFLTIRAYHRFLDESGLQDRIIRTLSEASPDNPSTIEKASKEIIELILNSKIPPYIRSAIKESYEELSVGRDILKVGGPALDIIKAGRGQIYVAVRQSPVQDNVPPSSFSGNLGFSMNVLGNEDINSSIKKCYAGLFTPARIFYRLKSMQSGIPETAVIIQKMINADKSGIIYTKNPENSSQEQIAIEAVWGYGEAISSGIVTPDSYVIAKSSDVPIARHIPSKKFMRLRNDVNGAVITIGVDKSRINSEVLGDDQIRKLVEISNRIESSLGADQRIEWVIEKNRVNIVQSNPYSDFSQNNIGQEQDGTVQQSGEIINAGFCASSGVIKGNVRQIGDSLLQDVVGKETIVVAKNFKADFIPWLSNAGAIITDEGSPYSSLAAVSARFLGIPCIVSTKSASTDLEEGQSVTVDATNGRVHERNEVSNELYPEAISVPQSFGIGNEAIIPHIPGPEEAWKTGNNQQSDSSQAGPQHPYSDEREYPVDSSGQRITATEIKANFLYPQSQETISMLCEKSDGVGLFRAEHLLTESGMHPIRLSSQDPEDLTDTILNGVGKVAKAFFPKPVWFRTMDARPVDLSQLEGGEDEPEEQNPILGWHGIRRSIDEPLLFKCELAAISRLNEQGLTNISILLPFISKIEELRAAKEMMANAGIRNLPGMLIETPAACLEIKRFCEEGISFVSIAADRLTELVLGVDRGNPKVSKLFDESDSAVIDLIKFVVRICRKHNVVTSICGEISSNPEMAGLLVEIGLDSVCAEHDVIEEMRKSIARAERKTLLDNARKQ